MRVATLLGQHPFALKAIALPQHEAQGLGPPDQGHPHLVIQPRVGRKGDCLLLHRRVHVHLLKFLRSDCLHRQRPCGAWPAITSQAARHRLACATCSGSMDRSATRAACTGGRRRIASTGSPPSGPPGIRRSRRRGASNPAGRPSAGCCPPAGQARRRSKPRWPHQTVTNQSARPACTADARDSTVRSTERQIIHTAEWLLSASFFASFRDRRDQNPGKSKRPVASSAPSNLYDNRDLSGTTH